MRLSLLLFQLIFLQSIYSQTCINTLFDDYAPGTEITNQLANVIVSVDNNSGPDIAMIFDSDNPTGGDTDLGAGLGHILIISEDGDSSDPDDDISGGMIIFDFIDAVDIDQMTLIDIENPYSSVSSYDEYGQMIDIAYIPETVDGGVVTMDLDFTNASIVKVFFFSSGAVDDFEYCIPFIPLPVALLSFEVNERNQLHEIEWSVIQEVNFDAFVIQHSRDGYTWQDIRKVPGGQDRYSFEYLPSVGENYYRLEMIDLDGQKNYSNIVQLYSQIGPFELMLSNNHEMQVFDLSGRSITQEEAKNGIYIIEYSGQFYKVAMF